MFKQTLESMVKRMDASVIGAILMDREGITLEKIGQEPDPTLDSETLGMEYSVILKNVMKTADMIDAGKVHEIFVQNDKFTTMLRMVNDEYFVAMFLRPGSNLGKGRILLRGAAARLRKEL
jgi:predicted regulator of Ras-like GTPase activity (Roadblock/LC7/MglB family)